MFWVPRRSTDPEIMDRNDNRAQDLEGALRDIERVNRYLGGNRALLGGLRPLLARARSGRPLKLLDVGTGGADLPLAMLRCARRMGRSLSVTAVDRDPVTAAIAARATENDPEIEVIVGDAAALPFPPRSFDIVTASMFLHHFSREQATSLLRTFVALAREAVLVNDLRRHLLPWGFIRLTAAATGRHPMFVHDAPLSVLRGFTPGELRAAASAARAGGGVVRRRWPFRLLLTIETGGAERAV